MIDYLVGFLVIAGGLFSLIAAVGVIRMPDVLIRMHASTKAGTLACSLILIAVAIRVNETGVTLKVIAAILFLLLTAPLAAHMIGRAAVRLGVPLRLKSNLPDAER